MTVGLVQPTPLYSAQYMIPLAGMLLGNSLSSNIIALQNLFTAFEERKTEYEAAISLGASPKYASFPFVQEAESPSNCLRDSPRMTDWTNLGGASPLVD